MDSGKEADKLILQYVKLDRSAKDILEAMPGPVLLKYISLLKAARKQGPPTKGNSCSVCGHVHNRSSDDYVRRMLYLRRAEQVLRGEWK